MDEKNYVIYDDKEQILSFKNYWVKSIENFELVVTECGYEKCTSLHEWGPQRKTAYVLHYILSGSGSFVHDGKEFILSAGDAFYCPMGEEVYYCADEDEPWEYMWVSFIGSKAKLIMDFTTLAESGVCHDTKDFFLRTGIRTIYEYSIGDRVNPYTLLGHLYVFLGGLIDRYKNTRPESDGFPKIYIDAAIDFIEKNYVHTCTVMDLSRYLGLTRTYIYKLFVRYFGISPTRYIEKSRMNHACELLKEGKLLVREVSKAVGYADQAYFSKVFKKTIGLYPKEYMAACRKQEGNEDPSP